MSRATGSAFGSSSIEDRLDVDAGRDDLEGFSTRQLQDLVCEKEQSSTEDQRSIKMHVFTCALVFHFIFVSLYRVGDFLPIFVASFFDCLSHPFVFLFALRFFYSLASFPYVYPLPDPSLLTGAI